MKTEDEIIKNLFETKIFVFLNRYNFLEDWNKMYYEGYIDALKDILSD